MGLTPAERTRRYRAKRLAEAATRPKVSCRCGCGTLLRAINTNLKPALYAPGHNPGGEGTRLTSARAIAYNKGRYQNKSGWKHTAETRMRMSERNHMRGKTGAANPFFGRHHSVETIAVISAKNSGANSPRWRGGVGSLPYGPEFTRALKRRILRRDGYHCQRCGKHQRELKGLLHVHHLDHDKQNNDERNLVAACCSCNVWASYHREEPFTSA